MSTLHIISKPLSQPLPYRLCSQAFSEGDAILLIEEGCYSAACCDAEQLLQGVALSEVYVLSEDLHARGLSDKLKRGYQRVDYDGFVALSCHHQPVTSWF